MNFTAVKFPMEQLHKRHKKCQDILGELFPQASGMLVFSRTNIYYLTGTRANGLLWLPRTGEPILMVRKAEERCRMESPLKNITSFKSYAHIPKICAEFGCALSGEVGVEMRGLSWSLANMLQERLKDFSFVAIDGVLQRARAIKSTYEMQRIQRCVDAQHKALFEYIPEHIKPGMSERHIAHLLWNEYFSLGHEGMLRKENYGNEIFLGSIAAGKNSLRVEHFEGCIGAVGEHPAMPHMGYAGTIWKDGELLNIDTGFTFEGYHSDMSVSFVGGDRAQAHQDLDIAHEQCADILESMVNQFNASPCTTSMKAQLQDVAQRTAKERGLNEFSFHVHGVGLSMDEELDCINIPDLEEDTSIVLAIYPRIRVHEKGIVGIKTLFSYDKTGLRSMNPVTRELQHITVR